MTILKIHHVGLTVGDLQRSIEFYCGVLGCSVIEQGVTAGDQVETITGIKDTRIATADLSTPGGHVLELIQYLHPEDPPCRQRTSEPGNTHIAFEVSNIDEVAGRLAAAGAIVRSAPIELKDAGGFWDGIKVFYALDPDGRTIEMVRPAVSNVGALQAGSH